MKKLKLWIISATVLCLLVAAMGICTVSASDGEGTVGGVVAVLDDRGNEIATYGSLAEAVQASKEGTGRIRLLADCQLESMYSFCGGEYVLDLNGKKLTCATDTVLDVWDDAKLTVIDRLTDGTIQTTSSDAFAILNSGELVLNGGHVIGAGGIANWSGGSLTVNRGRVTATVYSAIDNRSEAEINDGYLESGMGAFALENHASATVNDCDAKSGKGIINYDGHLKVNGGNWLAQNGPAIHLLGGEVTVMNGVFSGTEWSDTEIPLTASVSAGSTLRIEGGIYPDGFYADMPLVVLLSEGYAVYDEDYRVINMDDVEFNVEEMCYVYPANATAVAVDPSGKCFESFGSVSDAIDYALENPTDVVVLRDANENFEIPDIIKLDAGANRLSGDVINRGYIDRGVFSGTLTNYGYIFGGSYSGAVRNGDGGIIYGGTFDGEVTLDSGSLFQSDGDVSIGDGFKLTNNGGEIECTDHKGSATCTSDAICLICGEVFGEKDPNAHKEKTAATCQTLATCVYCEQPYGELAEHTFDKEGICTVEGCGVKAIILRGSKLYLNYYVAMGEAEEGDVLLVLRDFAIEDLSISAGVTLDATGFTVTLTEGDVSVYGTLAGGTLILPSDRVIGVEPGGEIAGGSFTADVNNAGTITGGTFTDCTIYNNEGGRIYNGESVFLRGDATVENLGGRIDCFSHYGGTATCSDHAVCMVCENKYGALDPDNHPEIVTDQGVDATCGQPGLTEGTHCEECDRIIVAQEEIPATGDHEWADATREAPKTCTSCGATEGDPLPPETESQPSDTPPSGGEGSSGTEPDGDAQEKKWGCSSGIGMGAFAIVLILGAALVFKKD